MSEVVIAPTRLLGKQRQTSINDIGHLPEGSQVAYVRQRFNDDVLDNQSKGVYIADSRTRNENYIEQELTIDVRSLVGKKSSEMPVYQADVSVMNKTNISMNTKAALKDLQDYREERYNMVSFPFTAAESLPIDMDLGGQG